MADFAFSGLNLAVTTSFADDGSIAFDRLEAHLEQYLDAGVTSFLHCSGTGPHVCLTRAEAAELGEDGLPKIGCDPRMPHALYAEAAGVIRGGANFAPVAVVAVIAAAEAGQWDRVREL